jgi:uncharacterized protein
VPGAAEPYNFKGQLLMKHGDADTVVPYPLARRLFDLANEPKTFFTEESGKHDGRSDEFYLKVESFIDRLD